MNLVIEGESPSVTAREWYEAANWYAETLLGKRMAKNIGLKIELVSRIRGRWGSIGCTDWRKRRSFIIEIATYGAARRKQLYTFGHEMVHLKQITRGELVVREKTMFWKTGNVATDDMWLEEPWEAEAYSRERYLFEEFEARTTWRK